MATSLANLATAEAADRSTLSSINSTLASSNAKIACLKSKLKNKAIPTTKTDPIMGTTAGHMVFTVGSFTQVHPASGLRRDTKKKQPKGTKLEVTKKNDYRDLPQTLIRLYLTTRIEMF